LENLKFIEIENDDETFKIQKNFLIEELNIELDEYFIQTPNEIIEKIFKNISLSSKTIFLKILNYLLNISYHENFLIIEKNWESLLNIIEYNLNYENRIINNNCKKI
jgi:hypothetical protein